LNIWKQAEEHRRHPPYPKSWLYKFHYNCL